MTERTLTHYRLLEPLGAGAMGVVYRARDERLERDVALKMLPEGSLADATARARLRREALALSRISHPYIATVFDFDHDDGTDFMVMELVSGATLAEKLAGGRMAERDIVTLGGQIAEALDAAHTQGVVHRDLKPLNIVVTTRGHAKVLDFGIASVLQAIPDGAVRHPAGSGTGGSGTLAYMAPEQLLGAIADPRSDLFALGVVLYEMATARLPFDAENAAGVTYEILNAAPPPPRRFREDLSARLEDVILKCLEKDPEYRYQSAREIAVDLRRIAAASAPAPSGTTPAALADRIQSLVVLPLENLSGDPEQEYFADGMTDALIADLTQIAGLRVISRTTAMRYKGAQQSLPAIARELNVDAVVEGTVLRAGERVRITAQLIEAATDRHLWARSYQRGLSDVLALQGEVARAIAQEIRLKLTPQMEARLIGARAVRPEAYEAYLKGRHLWNKRTEADVRRSLEHFNQAIDADPTYALAYAGLADSYGILGDRGSMWGRDAYPKARAAAMRALELNPQLAEAYTSLGLVWFFWEWNWTEAERSYRQAITLNPRYPTARQWYAEFLVSQGRLDEAVAEAQQAAALDPLSMVIGTTLADVLFFSRRFDEAIDQLQRTIDLTPRFVPARMDLGRSYAQSGRFDEAIAEFEAAAKLSGQDPDLSPGLGHTYAIAGRPDDARRVLARLVPHRKTWPVSAHAIGVIHAALGELDEAFAWLERAFEERDQALVWIRVHPRLDGLRDDPRLESIVQRMAFPS